MRRAALRWFHFQPGILAGSAAFGGRGFRRLSSLFLFFFLMLSAFECRGPLHLPQIAPLQAGELDLFPPGSLDSAGGEMQKERDKARAEFSLFDDVAVLLAQNWISRPGLGKAKPRSADDALLLESFTGVEYTTNQFGYYAGVISRVPGQLPRFKGVRLRAVQGMGWYRYERRRQVGPDEVNIEFMGHSRFLEGMLGYEWRAFDSIFKLYGGVISIEHDIDPRDEENRLQGRETGAKILLEAWHDFDNGAFLSAFGSYSTANDFYNAQMRVGLPLYEGLTGGIELGTFGDKQYDALRLGAFSEWQFEDAVLTFAGGVSGDYNEPDAFYLSGKYALKLYASDFLRK